MGKFRASGPGLLGLGVGVWGRGCLKIDHQQTGVRSKPPPKNPPSQKKALTFFGTGSNKEKTHYLGPLDLKEPPHYV